MSSRDIEETADSAFASQASASDTKPLGQLRDYELLEQIGQGGMGTVYRARHMMLKRIVALKVLPAERMNDKESVSRFRREMEAVGKLVHPNIVHAYDAGQDHSTHYLVMEYVDGLDAAQLVKQCGPLPIAEACEIIRQAATGLQYAHEHGLVHRDIKPSNLMVESRGSRVESQKGTTASAQKSDSGHSTLDSRPTVKILDLGLALLHDGDVAVSRALTTTGQVMGTLDYMAPEQGDDTHTVDIRADIYALGCTLYALLTGQPPFGGPEFSTPVKKLRAHDQKPPPPIRQKRQDIPAELAAVLERMLAKNPADRFATPQALADAIAPFAAGADLAQVVGSPRQSQSTPTGATQTLPYSSATEATATRPPQSDPIAPTIDLAKSDTKATLPPRRRWPIIAAAAVGALFLVATFFILNNNDRPPSDSREQARKNEVVHPTPDSSTLALNSQLSTLNPRLSTSRSLRRSTSGSRAAKSLPSKQDGTAMFTKIQDALDALKPGQVVEVLDRGSYQEKLVLNTAAKEIGLVTRVATIIQNDDVTKTANPLFPNHGHLVNVRHGFRLAGFVFTGKLPEESIAFHLQQHRDLVIENCVFATSGTRQCRIRSIQSEFYNVGEEATAFVRDCVIGDEMYCGMWDGNKRLVIVRNHFRNPHYVHFNIGVDDGRGRAHSLFVRDNVFDSSADSGIQFGVPSGPFNMETVIEHNTFFTPKANVRFNKRIADGGITIRRNILFGSFGVDLFEGTPAQLEEAKGRVRMEFNGFTQDIRSPNSFPPSSTDCVDPSPFLSVDVNDADYARLSPDSRFSNLANRLSAANGESYIGALPPGPAPPEGDWFTRLRERWKVAITLRRDEPSTSPAVPGATSNNSSNSTPSGSSRRSVTATFEEPPPLDEWLQGREILTVKQDGSAMFTKIQDALDALKPGQVVEVLDRGPYEENLKVDSVPDNTGWVSQVCTIVRATNSQNLDNEFCSHLLVTDGGFRVHGFYFAEHTENQRIAPQIALKIWSSGSLVIEYCAFDTIPLAEQTGLKSSLGIQSPPVPRHADPAIIRDCYIGGRVAVIGAFETQISIVRNFFFRNPTYVISINGSFPSVQVRNNVFHNQGGGGIYWAPRSRSTQLRVAENTFLLLEPSLLIEPFVPDTKLVFERNLTRGAIVLSDAAKLTTVNQSWSFSGNVYTQERLSYKENMVPISANDRIISELRMDKSVDSANYARATGGPSGYEDHLIGIEALPPGPAPPEGDWFTRLRERWQEMLAESQEPSDKSPEPK